eukprot:155841_1
MAQPKYKIEELYDIKHEQELLTKFVETALSPHDNSWLQHDSKNKDLQVDYKHNDTNNLSLTRAQTTIQNASITQYHELNKCGYNDLLKWEKENDSMCTEFSCVKPIDIDHSIVYGSFNSGMFMVSPRDFCYMRARYLLQNYNAKDGKIYDISCTLCYSIDNKHPYYRASKDKHVRADLKYSGYLFIKDQADTSQSVTACYIIVIDPSGWIPKWMIKLMAADLNQGKIIMALRKNWSKVAGILAERKKNGNKQDFECMFD